MPGHYCTYSQIRITGTWVCTCDFSHLAVAVHLFPSPNANTDAGLEAGLPRLFYMEYDSSPSISGNSTVGRYHLMVSCQIPSLKNKRIPKRRHGLNECRTLSGLSPLAREKNKHLGGGALSPQRAESRGLLAGPPLHAQERRLSLGHSGAQLRPSAVTRTHLPFLPNHVQPFSLEKVTILLCLN